MIQLDSQNKRIEALLEVINSSSQHVRNYYIIFLLTSFYIAVIIWSTTDEMLLKETPVNLPLLNVELSITGFYAFAPYFFLLIHLNLLLQLSLLSDKLFQFNKEVLKLRNIQVIRVETYYRARLFPFPFSYSISREHPSTFLNFCLYSIVWVSIVWLPLILLIGLQVGFLAYRSELILFLQRLAIILDLLFLIAFWPIIRSPDQEWASWFKQIKNNTRVMRECILISITVIFVVIFTWWIAVFPGSDEEKLAAQLLPDNFLTKDNLNTSREPYFRLTKWLFDQPYNNLSFSRNLILSEKILIANELKPEDQAALKCTSNNPQNKALLNKVIGLKLRNNDLRHAQFQWAVMPKVDFNFWKDVIVQTSDPLIEFSVNTDLSYTNFSFANLIEADFTLVKIQGAHMTKACLQRALFSRSKLHGTDLSHANLQGAKLNNAKLQGVKLYSADLQGADLRYAELQGANLQNAQLQKADLTGANLQGADLSNADLTCAKISYAKFGELTEQELKDLFDKMSQDIKDKKLLKKISNDFISRISKKQITIANENYRDTEHLCTKH